MKAGRSLSLQSAPAEEDGTRAEHLLVARGLPSKAPLTFQTLQRSDQKTPTHSVNLY